MNRNSLAQLLLCGLLATLAGCGDTEEEENETTSNAAGDTGESTSNGTGTGTTGSTTGGASSDAGIPDTGVTTEDTGVATEDTGVAEDSGGTQTDTSREDEPETGGEEIGAEELFNTVLASQGCSGGYCHGGSAGGLVLADAASAYDNLVDVDATTPLCGLTKRVVPGEPEQSLLWLRVRPAALDEGDPCAPKMPPSSEGLSAEDAQRVYDWIAAGAPQ